MKSSTFEPGLTKVKLLNVGAQRPQITQFGLSTFRARCIINVMNSNLQELRCHHLHRRGPHSIILRRKFSWLIVRRVCMGYTWETWIR